MTSDRAFNCTAWLRVLQRRQTRPISNALLLTVICQRFSYLIPLTMMNFQFAWMLPMNFHCTVDKRWQTHFILTMALSSKYMPARQSGFKSLPLLTSPYHNAGWGKIHLLFDDASMKTPLNQRVSSSSTGWRVRWWNAWEGTCDASTLQMEYFSTVHSDFKTVKTDLYEISRNSFPDRKKSLVAEEF